ncbi:MAG: STT3 domain-containing protein [Candidatus Nanohaloarchaea archaeon]
MELDPENVSAEDLKRVAARQWQKFVVAAVFSVALYLRYLPEKGMEHLQALDPYMIFRVAQHIALEGTVPAVNFMRYFPYPTPLYSLNQGDFLIPGILYNLGPSMVFDSFLEWAQFYPAFLGALSVPVMYLLGKELFDRRIGVSAAFFLAVIGGVLHRTSAGFFEKEPLGTFLMMVSLYCFTRAWRRKEYYSGIVSGVALGLFTISWGGSKMMWLLYPMIVGLMLWVDEDIRSMVVSYTPTVLLGAGIAASLNYSRFWFTSSLFLINIVMLGLLWGRYLVEELELVDKNYLKYYTPTVSVSGLIFVLISPMFWDWPMKKFLSLISTGLQSGGGVVGGTVAENQAPSIGQLASQLGAVNAYSMLPDFVLNSGAIQLFIGFFKAVGPFTLAFIGVTLLGSRFASYLLSKYSSLGDEIKEADYFKLVVVVLGLWTLTFSFIFPGNVLRAVAPGILMVLIGVITSFFLIDREKRSIEPKWFYIIPLIWGVTNILGAVARSRLVFLSAFATSFVAGYAFVKGLEALREVLKSYSVDYRYIIGAVVAIVVTVNFASGFTVSQGLGGSPNQLWMDNLGEMRENAPEGSVVLSWWDYGYWFQQIGRSGTVADGGNLRHYSSGAPITYPLADFLTSENPSNHTDFLKKHSVDYIVLDETMIGKYSAVSQISKGSNKNFNSMAQLSTSRNILRSEQKSGGSRTITFSGRGLRLYMSVNMTNQSVEFNSAPTIETRRGRSKIDCLITEDGRKQFNVSGDTGYCIGLNPYYSIRRAYYTASRPKVPNSPAKVVLVPGPVQDSTLVKLYLGDGRSIDFVEKMPEASNGFVKMWKINLNETE